MRHTDYLKSKRQPMNRICGLNGETTNKCSHHTRAHTHHAKMYLMPFGLHAASVVDLSMLSTIDCIYRIAESIQCAVMDLFCICVCVYLYIDYARMLLL